MKNSKLHENFKEEYYDDAIGMTQKELSIMRRNRKVSDFLHNNNGEWFSFYDNIREINQWASAFSDIIYAFSVIYNDFLKNIKTNTKFFVTCTGRADMKNLEKEIYNFIKYKKMQCNYIVIPESAALSDIDNIANEIKNCKIPSVILIENSNHTFDDVEEKGLSEKEVSDIIEKTVNQVMPSSGIVIFMETMSFNDNPYSDRTNVTNESVSSWLEQNNKDFSQAVDYLAQEILTKHVSINYFKNATDLAKCDYIDIQAFCSIEDNLNYNKFEKLVSNPYSIRKIVSEYKEYGADTPWENLVKENWKSWLEYKYNSKHLVYAIYDLCKVSSITDKNLYGGGEFEVMRELEICTAKAVAKKIKKRILGSYYTI